MRIKPNLSAVVQAFALTNFTLFCLKCVRATVYCLPLRALSTNPAPTTDSYPTMQPLLCLDEVYVFETSLSIIHDVLVDEKPSSSVIYLAEVLRGGQRLYNTLGSDTNIPLGIYPARESCTIMSHPGLESLFDIEQHCSDCSVVSEPRS